MPAQAARQDELRALVAKLEQSGLADRREDVARLLAHSRALLAAGQAPAPAARLERQRRPRPVGARARLRAALLVLLDMAALAALAFGAVGLGAGRLAATGGIAALGGAALWGVLRWGGAPTLLAEGAARLAYGLRWAALWLAEPFHLEAWEKLEALLDAREVMRAWRRHKAGLPGAGLPGAGLAEVEAFLTERYGSAATERFRAAIRARTAAGWTLRGGGAGRETPLPEARLLRWSTLIRLFEVVAKGGALWPAAADDSEREALPAPVPSGAEPRHPQGPSADDEAERQREAERESQRENLRDLIRRRRQDITTAHNWKLKTSAEIAQRDAYLEGLRSEIGELERELAALMR